MVGSVLTLAGFIAWVISVIPVMQKYTWRVYLERISIFKLYNPVNAVSGGEFVIVQYWRADGHRRGVHPVAFVAFNRRDLPANG